ncbi:MAG: hypothetical protein ACRD4O_09280 [Bryobacteraceae bacterium]
MHFEAALNLLWVSLGLIALAAVTRAALGRRRLVRTQPAGGVPGLCSHRSVWLHFVGVSLVVLTLFPSISATDDMVRIERFCAQASHQHTNLPGKHSQTDNLIRLYNTMETPLVCTAAEISLVFFFICLVFTPAPRPLERIQPREAGRSPPAFA